jgi:hypothetical protein
MAGSTEPFSGSQPGLNPRTHLEQVKNEGIYYTPAPITTPMANSLVEALFVPLMDRIVALLGPERHDFAAAALPNSRRGHGRRQRRVPGQGPARHLEAVSLQAQLTQAVFPPPAGRSRKPLAARLQKRVSERACPGEAVAGHQNSRDAWSVHPRGGGGGSQPTPSGDKSCAMSKLAQPVADKPSQLLAVKVI